VTNQHTKIEFSYYGIKEIKLRIMSGNKIHQVNEIHQKLTELGHANEFKIVVQHEPEEIIYLLRVNDVVLQDKRVKDLLLEYIV